ncbi:hypothetical protein IEE86_03235 [Bacillus sp. 28A-2]|uniref:hypothetical protein n=1 Tax=Bacillus sp. 28A-2 TaxID=2772252 RepID=UPI00168D5994|nr:hypothetical protein [Bacillus sp. 28A-2]MBD3858735.1 hypothetical protein [Bacillus sp. 28A-2]
MYVYLFYLLSRIITKAKGDLPNGKKQSKEKARTHSEAAQPKPGTVEGKHAAF